MYVLRHVLLVFIVCLVIFTFVLFVGNMLKIIELISQGISGMVIMKFLLYLVPFMLSYSIPMSILTAVLLSFAKLSAENEITAIRASGINLFSLILPIIILGIILSLTLVIFNDRAASYAHYAYRKTLIDVGIKNPTAALEEGVFINSFQKYKELQRDWNLLIV